MDDLPNLRVGVSPLSNRIFAGYSKPVKGTPGVDRWTRKQDVTAEAVTAVIEHLLDGQDGMEWSFSNADSTVTIVITRKPLANPTPLTVPPTPQPSAEAPAASPLHPGAAGVAFRPPD